MAKPNIDLKDYESGFARFDSLMQFKVKDILLVSSMYDSFILEEDGHVAQLIFNEYVELNLSFAPQMKRVSTGEEALKLLAERNFDLVMVFRKLGDMDIIDFGRKAKEIVPAIPVVLLAFHPRELNVTYHPDFSKAVDKPFFWGGEANILLAIVKYIEDRINVDFDTRLVGVRVIILIEDSIRFYSSYLPLLYGVIMRQTQALMADGLNLSHKLIRMRARPKILLADSYEQGLELYQKYNQYLLGIISDIKFSKSGQPDDLAGLKLARKVKKQMPDLPILLQSSNLRYVEEARAENVAFLHKRTPALLTELRHFIRQNFGFGDFVFRLPDGTEVARADDFHSMEQCLKEVPEASLIFHASRNHFSNWLMARTEFDLANRLRPRKVSEFKNAEAVRAYLMDTFKSFRYEKQLGIVTDFSRKQFDLQSDFVRIGDGSLGGKGRGLAFISRLLRRYNVYDSFEGVRINVPPSAILGTSVFDSFLEQNNLLEYALGEHSNQEIAAAFQKASLPKNIRADLGAYMEIIKYPLAVRSSSLLEDSHYQPFAGIFDTHMLPNCHPSKKVRLERLEEAIKFIYATIFSRKSKKYIEATGNRVEEEKMAIILQKVVGSHRNNSFYPVISGIARSYNFYPIGNIRPKEGVVYAALGLGKTIVEGGNCLYFSPSNPQNLPQFSSAKDFLDNSQQEFFAVDMSDPLVHPAPGAEAGLIKLRKEQAMTDGS
ncbi:MAG: PEP/pyruvate-binding domain-containing protein, partial [Candidatus Zixiibacteriota bacterium]